MPRKYPVEQGLQVAVEQGRVVSVGGVANGEADAAEQQHDVRGRKRQQRQTVGGDSSLDQRANSVEKTPTLGLNLVSDRIDQGARKGVVLNEHHQGGLEEAPEALQCAGRGVDFLDEKSELVCGECVDKRFRGGEVAVDGAHTDLCVLCDDVEL